MRNWQMQLLIPNTKKSTNSDISFIFVVDETKQTISVNKYKKEKKYIRNLPLTNMHSVAVEQVLCCRQT